MTKQNGDGASRSSDDPSEWAPGILCDTQIEYLAMFHGMIDPFVAEPVRDVVIDAPPHSLDDRPTRKKVVSYGLTSYGYDLRVVDEWKVFTQTGRNIVVDPKDMDQRSFVEVSGDGCVVIPPNSFVLARSMERFKIPRDVLSLIVGKSTYARCGLIVNCTPMEPLWEGYLTIEISNTTPLPARVHANEGIAQAVFFKGSRECVVNYANKNHGKPGKYQDQGPQIITSRM